MSGVGAFSQGLFGGFSNVMNMYGAFYNLRQTATQFEGAEQARNAMQTQAAGEGQPGPISAASMTPGSSMDTNPASPTYGQYVKPAGSTPDPYHDEKKPPVDVSKVKDEPTNKVDYNFGENHAKPADSEKAPSLSDAALTSTTSHLADEQRVGYGGVGTPPPITAATTPAQPQLTEGQRRGTEPLPAVKPVIKYDPTQAGTPLAKGVMPQPNVPPAQQVSPTQMQTYDTPQGGYQAAPPAPAPAPAAPGPAIAAPAPAPAPTPPLPGAVAAPTTPAGQPGLTHPDQLQPPGGSLLQRPSAITNRPIGSTITAPGGTPQNVPPGMWQPPQPGQPSTAPTLGSRILGAINPIGSAQAAETPPPGGVNAPQPGAPAPAAPAPAWDAQKPAAAAASPAPVTPTTKAGGIGASTPAQQATAPPPPTPQAPAPASTTTKAEPQQQAAAVPVAGTQGTQTQSEKTPVVAQPNYTTMPYRALSQRPELKSLVDKVAEEEHISPDRLALHWYLESGLRTSSPESSAGARGIMQLIPSTEKMMNRDGKWDNNTVEGSLHLGARYINYLDSHLGKDTVSSVAGYFAGPENVGRLSGDKFESAKHDMPRTWDYLNKAYGHTDNINGSMFTEYKPGDWQTLVKAGVQGGPEGMLQALVATGPKGMQMSDLWRRAQITLTTAALMRGDYAGAQHAQDFVAQMSQQGASANLMAADKALLAGDTQGASQFLAKAHAFFPDGTYGRFGHDDKGNLYGERFDELTGKSMGKPFQITHEALAAQLITTQNPNEYLKLVTEQQKAASEIRKNDLYGPVEAAKLGIESRKVDVSERQVEETAKLRQAQQAETKEYRERTAQDREDAATARQEHAVDIEASHFYGPDNEDAAALTPKQRAGSSQLYRGLRLSPQQGGGTMSGNAANEVSNTVMKDPSKYTLEKKTEGGVEGYRLVDKDGVVHGYLSGPHGAALAPFMKVVPSSGGEKSPVGKGAGSQSAMAQGIGMNLANQPQQSMQA
jgi:soluble lytic murein transglycosylase-like protein